MHKVDFHLHTTASDGLLTPSEVVKRAVKNNVSHIAITDHDTVFGIEEALNEAKKHNIVAIPGIEFSTYHNNENIHVLGYFKDDSYKAKEVVSYINNLKEMRFNRALEMVKRLKEHFNIEISVDNLIKRSKGVVGRPHIAQEIIDSGYDYSWEYIFDNFIGNDSPAFIPANRISTEDGVKLLKSFNCVVSLAHPVLIKKSPLSDFSNMGFDAIEAIYFLNTKEEEESLKAFAKENNLLTSCGSDCHGKFETDKKHGDIGDKEMTDEEFNSFISLFK